MPVALVAADRPCRALEIAAERDIPTELLERTEWGTSFDRAAYTERLVKVLRTHAIDLVLMAGFGTVVPGLTDAYPGRVLNSHPALLPAFKGWHAVRDALAAGVKVTGTTVHVATADVDEGPILAQEPVPVDLGRHRGDAARAHQAGRVAPVSRDHPPLRRRYVRRCVRR